MLTRVTSLLGVVLSALAFAGCKSVDAQLTIPAPPEQIWSVLMDGESYGEWNPVLVQVEGEFREGERLTYQMMTESGEPTEVEARVVKLDPGRELNQAGGIWGILTFDHHWILEPVEGGTRVTQHEDYEGIGVLFFDPSWFESAYDRGNHALRERVLTSSDEVGPDGGRRDEQAGHWIHRTRGNG